MNVVTTILGLLGPAIIGVLTVPVFDLLKRVTLLKGKLPAWVQQLSVPVLAYALTWIGALTNTILPASLELFTADHVSALLASAIAMAAKAGRQAKTAVVPLKG